MIKNKTTVLLLLLICIFFLFACNNKNETSGTTSSNTASNVTSQPKISEPQKSQEEIIADNSKKKLDLMTDSEKVAQLFIVTPSVLDEIKDKDNSEVSGVIFFSDDISTPDNLKTRIESYQKYSTTPLFVGIDEEGGSVSRIANNENFDVEKFSDMNAYGNQGDTDKAYTIGKTIGSYLKSYGFNLDFAPVCDVVTNKKNTVIGKRSFGSDPYLVSSMIENEINGFHDNNIISVSKHFPGHGDTKSDTHNGSVTLNKSYEQLESCELIPFKKAIDSKVDMIMVSHIIVPSITKELPSSMSYDMMTGKLRNEMNFDGVIITDSFSMGAITKNYSSDKASVLAFTAGADIILMPEDYARAFDGILSSLKSGKISESRLNESVLRILKLKETYKF